MKIIRYRPIRLPWLRAIVCGIILYFMVSSVSNVFVLINKNINYPYREVEPEKLYFIYENEKIVSSAEKEHVVLFYEEEIVYNMWIHMLVLTPEKKLVYIMGSGEEMGDYYSFELMMTKGTYNSCSFAGTVRGLDKETKQKLESHITKELLDKYGVTSENLSDVYIRMEMSDDKPEMSDIVPHIILSVMYLVLLCVALWPFLRNRIYHSRVKNGKMEMDPLEIKEEGLDYHPSKLYHEKSDDLWLTDNSGLDKDRNDGYYNNINTNDNDGGNGDANN